MIAARLLVVFSVLHLSGCAMFSQGEIPFDMALWPMGIGVLLVLIASVASRSNLMIIWDVRGIRNALIVGIMMFIIG
jgi:hypothetical protein